eukprot:TRINITY_DN67442_c0_g1_i1.p2 TRINITY_DN67442_c0_g1~~TRINITY_DN67442_c0_g1_i1.p2  ORF type:complete len:118 (-),score=8.52 TRINITY_DN67442_c0_g1_i1:36-389(-)
MFLKDFLQQQFQFILVYLLLSTLRALQEYWRERERESVRVLKNYNKYFVVKYVFKGFFTATILVYFSISSFIKSEVSYRIIGMQHEDVKFEQIRRNTPCAEINDKKKKDRKPTNATN